VGQDAAQCIVIAVGHAFLDEAVQLVLVQSLRILVKLVKLLAELGRPLQRRRSKLPMRWEQSQGRGTT
jgi:hypothetical protein